MIAAHAPSHLIERLPPLTGRAQADVVLAPGTWFRVGGPAEVLVRPSSATDLARFLAALPVEIPVVAIGAASNLIVRDGGVPGVVVRLARGFAGIEVEADGVVAGAAALDVTVAENAAAAGLAGLEFLSGIPGSIGGAVAMNAGAYGGDVAACLDWAEVATRSGALVRLGPERLGFGYRHAALPPGGIVVRARTGGSTFRNPPPGVSAMKAWELIEAAGCRGLAKGGAQVSEMHCNFLLNTGAATAADIEGLGEEVRRRVAAACGVTLDWEIRRIGRPEPAP